MERQPVDDAQLGAAIEAVAQAMTEGEPSAALKARVLVQIRQEPRPFSAVLQRWAWAGAAAAVLLAVATAVWVVGPIRVEDSAQSAVAGQRSAPPLLPADSAATRATQPAVSAGAASPADVPTAAARTSRAPAARGVRAAEVEGVEDLHAVPALAEIEPLRFSAVEPDPLQIAAVNVAALPAMPSIEIPSLGTGSDDIQSADPKKEK
jgi:hypothetical protein